MVSRPWVLHSCRGCHTRTIVTLSSALCIAGYDSLVSRPWASCAQIVYADAMTLFKHSAVTDLHYDHETVSGWFDYICDEKTPCITTARFDGARRVCLKRCYPGRHQV